MDTADLQVMSHPPFDPATDVRITHTVHQGRAGAPDRNGGGPAAGVILNHYLRGPSVGKGQHGTVYKCWDLAQSSVEVVRVISIVLPPQFIPSFLPFPFFSFVFLFSLLVHKTLTPFPPPPSPPIPTLLSLTNIDVLL
jgi:hypothetical protein